MNALALYNSNPFTPAGTNANTGLSGDPTRRANALAAGPARATSSSRIPDMLGGANVTGNGGFTTLQLLPEPVPPPASRAGCSSTPTTRSAGRGRPAATRSAWRQETQQTGGGGDVTHALKVTWVYELPFGRGKRFGSDVGTVVNGFVGGWSVNGTTRIQSGRLARPRQRARHRHDRRGGAAGLQAPQGRGREYYMWPQDIIDNTIKAYNTSVSTASGFAGAAPSGRYFSRPTDRTASRRSPTATATAACARSSSPGRCTRTWT